MVAWLYKNAFWLCEFVHFIKYNLMTMRWLASGCFVLSRQHGRFQRNGCEKTDWLIGSEYIKVKQLSCKPMSNCKVKCFHVAMYTLNLRDLWHGTPFGTFNNTRFPLTIQLSVLKNYQCIPIFCAQLYPAWLITSFVKWQCCCFFCECTL